ncbi:MAG TPA: ATP-binding protein [Oligoflexia bacterium]|nr:ATP-binding protein [Oligoflexia bacterium]HMP48698.1 ATP-binding protein [Oligoflexia bacterium]
MTTVSNKTLEIQSNLEEVAIVGISSRAIAESLSFSEGAAYEIELAVVEAVTNCIEHAYLYQSDKTVFIQFDVSNESLTIKVEDSGIYWRNFDEQTSKSSPFEFDPEDIENLPEGGMGVSLLVSLMDEVKYERKNNINTLTLKKHLK